MPIHNLGYREWEGERESGGSRWSVVAGIGIRRAWQSTWLRRIAFVVWGPPLAYAVLIFGFEQFLGNQSDISPRQVHMILRATLPRSAMPEVVDALNNIGGATDEEKMKETRPVFWKGVMLQLQRSQCIGMVFVIGLIAPALISQDAVSYTHLTLPTKRIV